MSADMDRQPDVVDDDYEEMEAGDVENPDSEQQLGECLITHCYHGFIQLMLSQTGTRTRPSTSPTSSRVMVCATQSHRRTMDTMRVLMRTSCPRRLCKG